MVDGAVTTFRDTSSANSIHHALVSGGGVHHSKAVTLKSDGTNGTSTTDHLGNTISWVGSNSTVTFANSSSFDYGNTAIRILNGDTTYLTAPNGGAFTIGSGTAVTVELWVYQTVDNSADATTWLSTWNGGPRAGFNLGTNYNGNAGKTFWEYASGTTLTGTTDIRFSGWHHIAGVLSGTHAELYVNGILENSTAYTSGITEGSSVFTIGDRSESNRSFEGHFDEIMFTAEHKPPRFYLGNQAPEADATFNEFKYATFAGGGTGPHYIKNTGVDNYRSSDTQGTILAWVYNITPSTYHSYFSSCYSNSPNDFHIFGVNTSNLSLIHI